MIDTTTFEAPVSAPDMNTDLAQFGLSRCTWCGSSERDTYNGAKGLWHRCRNCGLWLSSLLVDPQDYAVNDYGIEYQKSYYGSSLTRKLRNCHHRFNIIEKLVPNKGSFLDIGSSYGSMLVAGRERGWSTHGVELSPAMVELSCQNGLNVRLGTMTEIPFDDESFDVVHARHVLEHDVQTYRALQSIYRVTKPGGMLLIEVPDGDCRRARSNPASEAERWSYVHMVTFTQQVLSGFLRRVGWQPIPDPFPVSGSLPFLGWYHWKSFRERTRIATYFITYWRKPL